MKHSDLPAQPYSPPGREEEEEEVVVEEPELAPRWLNRFARTDCILPISLFRETWTRGRSRRETRRGAADRQRDSP